MRKGGDNFLNPVNSSHVHQLFPPFVGNRRLDSALRDKRKISKYWSALATAHPQLQLKLGLRKPLISLKLFCNVVSNHKTTTSKLYRKLKFGTQSYFKPTKRNMKNRIE